MLTRAHLPGAVVALLFWLSLALLPQLAQAHKASDSYLSLTVAPNGQNQGQTHISGQWDIALRDLEMAIGLDGDGNGALTWEEIRAKHPQIAAYALAHLDLHSAGQACQLTVGEQLIDQHSDGAYAVLRLLGHCPGRVETLQIQYSLLFEIDPQHKGLLNFKNASHSQNAIFSPDHASQIIQINQAGSLSQWLDFVQHGVWHIWIGFDHILFLISLLLPAVLVISARQWQPAGDFKSALVEVVKVVSAFTLAHSITLTLASLNLISLPSRLVESMIAASVLVAAINNLYPVVQGRRWIAAFGFGLIHGFGFASVLADLGLAQSSLALALFGFNLGVELGQLCIVAAFLPMAFYLRKTWTYRRVVLGGGSVAIAILACGWLLERSLDLKLDVWS